MRRSSFAVILALLAAGCTGKVGDRELWGRACERSLETIGELSDEAKQECLASMATHPPSIADDMARCIMNGPADVSPEAEKAAFDACISPATREHLDRQAEAQRRLDELGERLREREGTDQALPSALVELTGTPVLDPWGHPLAYEVENDGFTLCSVGPDGRRGSPDDLCYVQPFIYFQF